MKGISAYYQKLVKKTEYRGSRVTLGTIST